MLRTPHFASSGVQIDMTPMIDIVFQLLAFFIFTLRIISQEGDLEIKLPRLPGPGPTSTVAALPLQIRLTAGENGSLAAIRLNDLPLANLEELRGRILKVVGDHPLLAAEMEAEIQCDEKLAYQHTMAAITAISGRRDNSGHIQPLIRKVRLK